LPDVRQIDIENMNLLILKPARTCGTKINRPFTVAFPGGLIERQLDS